MTITAIDSTGRAISRSARSDAFANITPNWFATVMGTGIIATATTSLPITVSGASIFAVIFWLLACLLLIAVTTATAAHWRLHPVRARSHQRDPVMVHFYGAAPMALLTVGTSTLLAGTVVIGPAAAVAIDWTLWVVGTIGGLATAITVPFLCFTRISVPTTRADAAFGGWLMPVVPPMVSAASGALLIPHTPGGQLRLTLLVVCYALFGLSLVASVLVIAAIWIRLATHGTGTPRLVPTLWIVLGPLGQSITAANLLGAVAGSAGLPYPYATGLRAFGLVYGLPVWGFAMLWLGLAVAITVRVAREHLPFSLTWWSFTFPVGTVVTGTSALAMHTGATVLRMAAVVGFVALVGAWLIVATRTVRATGSGALLGISRHG